MDWLTILSIAAAIVTIIGGIVGGFQFLTQHFGRRAEQRRLTRDSSQPPPLQTSPPSRVGNAATAPQSGGFTRRALIGTSVSVAMIGAVGTLYAASKGIFFTAGASARDVINVYFTYSTEKSQWVRAAAKQFNSAKKLLGNKVIQIVLDERGSGNAKDLLLGGNLSPMPTAWSPASLLELTQLSASWETQNPEARAIISASERYRPQSLVSSPLVLASWQERLDLLVHSYGKLDWSSLSNALTQKAGWSSLGGKPEWGLVKFGQTRPDTSNSGLLTVTLLAASYFPDLATITADQVRGDAGFTTYLKSFEDAVPAFGNSSGTYFGCAIQDGPATRDVFTTYENLVIAPPAGTITASTPQLGVVYPSPNIVSDHPFAILQSAEITDEQQAAAAIFRDYLLDVPQQRAAIAQGFRPGNAAVKLTDPAVSNNPFARAASVGITIDSQPKLIALPKGEVLDALIVLWQSFYQNSPVNC